MAKLAPPILRRAQASTPTLPSWAVPASLALSLAGLAVSTYLTVEHFRSPNFLACPVGGTNCTRVTTSPQSSIIGIPVAVLGLVFFAAIVVLCLPQMWRLPDPRVWKTRVVVAAVGVLFVLWLIFAELFLVEAICAWCTVVHVLTFSLFAVIALATALADFDAT